MHKDVRQLIRRLRKQDFDVCQTDGGHYRVSANGGPYIVIPATPSDWRSLKNAKSRLRKIGYCDR